MKRDNYVSLRGTVHYVSTTSRHESRFNMINSDASIFVSVKPPVAIDIGDEVLVRGKLRAIALYTPDEGIFIEAEYVENKTTGLKWWAKK